MVRSHFFHRVSITVLSLCALGSSARAAAPLQLTSGVNAGEFRITPDGSRIVFESYNGTDNVLYSARTDGIGSPILISPSTGPSFLSLGKFTPDSSRFVFNTYEEPADGFHVATYSNRLDGSGRPVLLNNSKVYDDDPGQYNLAISPDGQRVVIHADQGDYNFDLLSRAVDGSGGVVALNGAPHSYGNGVGYFIPAGNRIVFTAPLGGVGLPLLFSRVFDGSAPAVQLTPNEEGYPYPVVSGDGSKVVLMTQVASVANLYSVNVDGGPLTLLASEDNKPNSFQGLTVDPHGRHVVFSTGGQLWTVPTDGSAAPKPLTPNAQGITAWATISPNGTQVAMAAQEEYPGPVELFIGAIDGSSAPKKLSAPMPAGGNINSFYFTPDGSHIVFWGDQITDGVNELFSVPTDGSRGPVRLTSSGNFRVTPDGRNVIYATGSPSGDGLGALYQVGIDGGEPILLAENPYSTGAILPWGEGWQISSGGSKLIFTADDGAGTSAIFAVAIPEPGGVVLMLGAMIFCRRRPLRANR